ncbi:MAG: LTA synthase family protein [Lachnospiraceae bacterium]|nr:LTA synthase family protein [Lachnospiraceae bacterium]
MDYPVKKYKNSNLYTFLQLLLKRLAALLKLAGITRERYSACIAMLVCPAITFYLFDLYTNNPFTDMQLKIQLLNIAFYIIVELMLLGVFGRARTAMMLQTAVFMILGLANYYVVSFRSTPIMPWDIFSIKTAGSVADNYSYKLEWEALLVLAGFVLLLVIESRFKMKAPAKKRKRLAITVASAALLYFYVALVQNDSFHSDFGLYDKLFTPAVMSMRDGNAVAFIMELKYINVDKPESYSAEAMEEFYNKLSASDGDYNAALEAPSSVHRPNIIVIMDEAFSDLSVLGDFETNEDYMPFIHSLQQGADNTVTGTLNVSVLGGNTANTEFEFLTGNTMAFLPSGSVAYQQYVKNETPSLASYLKALGYSTIAVHPYNASGWDRNRVYPLLGFDSFYSLKNFSNTKKIRDYVSDESDFEKLKSLYEAKEEGEPLFIFNVTMQNHSGYDTAYDNFTPDVTVEGAKSQALSMYLSLIRRTDSAFEDLIKYFENQEEDTVIVFFGDHQPTAYVSNPILRSNNVEPNSLTEEETLLRYKVPYVIWANFDIDESTGTETSVNYLMTELLEKAGLPLPPYQSFLSELREDYPVISAVSVSDSEGELSTVGECREELELYNSLQYYLLFDYEE